MPTHPAFHRSELLLGEAAMRQLAETRVILFGVGGVGSWCAEALIRTGLGHLTIVDSDAICVTNLNRQLQATRGNLGKVKVAKLAERLRSICPEADIAPIQRPYNQDTRDSFDIPSYDYVIDAIDSLGCKIDLIRTSLAAGRTLFSAMGAACKLDPTEIRVSSIWKTKHCPLARQVRKRLRRQHVDGDFLCVYSEELALEARGSGSACGSGTCYCPRIRLDDGAEVAADEWCSKKAQINGSIAHMTGTFGFILSGLVIQDIAGMQRD